jgi:outer membrane murein-binding lipoprotein Lpp
MGGFYQIVGILCAAVGISQTRRAWSKLPGAVGQARFALKVVTGLLRERFLRVFPSFRKPMVASLTGSVSATSSVSGTVTVKLADPGFTVESRIEWLLDRVHTLMDQVSRLESAVSQGAEEIAEARKEAVRGLENLEQATSSQLRNLAAGGLRLQTWGVLYLIAGAFLIMLGSDVHGAPSGLVLVILIVVLLWSTAITILTYDYASDQVAAK